jgi:hypothetical protein
MIGLIALLDLSLMTGSEICIAVFVNPMLRQLPEEEQVPFLRRGARRLGFLMPFWYFASLLLAVISAISFHRDTGSWGGGALYSAILQACIILMTITLLVPINNRFGKLREGETGWTPAARRWDHLHQVRVLLLLLAVVLLAC